MISVSFSLPDGFTVGGVTTWSIKLCNLLKQKGVSSSIIQHKTFNPILQFHLNNDVPIFDCSDLHHADSPFIKKKDIVKYKTIYSEVNADVLIPNWSYGTYAACAALTLSKESNAKIVGFIHTDEQIYYDWVCFYESIISHFVCVSDEIMDKLIKLLPHREKDMEIKPYGVDVDKNLSRRYSDDTEPLQLIYAGRISQRQKRIFDLTRLAKALVKHNVNFDLTIIGNGNESAALKKQISDLDPAVKERISFQPGVPPAEMKSIWRSSDIFISVSEYEGTSISMLEAMSNGCIPVVTKVSGTGAVISQGENGFLSTIGDIEQMARSIADIDQNRQRLTQLGHAAHATIVQTYNFEDYVSWFSSLIINVSTKKKLIWNNTRPLFPQGLGAIKKEEFHLALKRDPDAIRIILHKLLHLSRLAGPFYTLQYLFGKIAKNT